MKAILVIDVPDDIDLDRYRANGYVQQVIFDLEKGITYSNPIEFNFCSLKPMPEQMSWGHSSDYIDGYNACLEEITDESNISD